MYCVPLLNSSDEKANRVPSGEIAGSRKHRPGRTSADCPAAFTHVACHAKSIDDWNTIKPALEPEKPCNKKEWSADSSRSEATTTVSPLIVMLCGSSRRASRDVPCTKNSASPASATLPRISAETHVTSRVWSEPENSPS